MTSIMFLLHIAMAWLMTGVIWIVQLVHYPLFDYVDKDSFAAFEAQHVARISWIVMPVMLVELGTGLWLVWQPIASMSTWFAWANVACLLTIWLSTFALSVPQHKRLQERFSREAHRKLVLTNWPRTLLWSLRAVGLGYIALHYMPKT